MPYIELLMVSHFRAYISTKLRSEVIDCFKGFDFEALKSGSVSVPVESGPGIRELLALEDTLANDSICHNQYSNSQTSYPFARTDHGKRTKCFQTQTAIMPRHEFCRLKNTKIATNDTSRQQRHQDRSRDRERTTSRFCIDSAQCARDVSGDM